MYIFQNKELGKLLKKARIDTSNNKAKAIRISYMRGRRYRSLVKSKEYLLL